MLSMKADANRKHTKLENKALILFALLLSYLVNFTAWLFADRLISCRRIINDAKDFSTHQWNFLASIALSLRIISRFKGFLRLINLEISIFLEQIFTSGIILNETAKTKSVKFIYCTLKDILSTKTMKELCASRRFSFVFGCELSASAGNLLKLFSRYCKNWPMRVICRAGKWTEITVH